jgi:hypothetical protein
MSSATAATMLATAGIVAIPVALRLFGRYLTRNFGYGRSPLRKAKARPEARAQRSPFGEERLSSPFGED